MKTKPTLILLAGGKGTRLQSLEPNRPKPMILVGGKPFLHWLVEHYTRLGHRHFIFSTGHLAEVVETHDWRRDFPDSTFEFARETTPLGTGGAVQAIFRAHGLERAWVINGDTFLPVPLPEPPAGLDALFTALEPSQVFDATPNLVVDGGFVVAEGAKGQAFDAGAVFLNSRAALSDAGPPPFSIQKLLSPAMAGRRVGYAVVAGTCYDIGTPERYRRFEVYLSRFIRQST